MTLYFHAIRMVDVIISLAIVETFHKIDKNIRSVLIISSHPLYDYADMDLLSYFDDVYVLPHCDYDKNLIKGYIQCSRHYKKLREIRIEKNHTFFFFDDSELPCFNLYKFVNTLSDKVKDRLVHLVYQYDPIRYKMVKDTKVAYLRTILVCLYSLVLFGKKVICRYLPRNLKKHGRSFKPDFDCEVFLNRKSPKGFESEFEDFPVDFDRINLAGANITSFKPNSILFLGHNLRSYMSDREKFAESMNLLLDRFRSRFGQYNLYLKLHPHDCREDYTGVYFDGFEMVGQKESLEKVIVSNRAKIKVVYSVCSSGNFCSAMLGIPSYLLYPLFGFGAQIEEYFEKIFFGEEDVSNLYKANSLNDIGEDNVRLSSGVSGDKTDTNKWSRLYERLRA